MKRHNYSGRRPIKQYTTTTPKTIIGMSWRDTDSNSRSTHIFLAFLVGLLLFLCAVTDRCSTATAAGNSEAKSKIPYDVVEALNDGQKLRSSKEGHAKFMANVYAVYEEYGPWFWQHRGQRPPLAMAMHVWIESKGNALAHTGDYKLGEVGLFSVKKAVSKQEDINPCHPLLNTWAAQKTYHERRAQIMGWWPWLLEEDEEQQLLMMALVEGIGSGATYYLVEQLGNKHEPYNKIVAYIKKKGNKLYDVDKWGRQSANVVAFRVGCAQAFYNKVWEAQNQQWCTLPGYTETEKPYVDDGGYPGFKALLKCEENYADFGTLFPSPGEREAWLKDMSSLNCTPQDF